MGLGKLRNTACPCGAVNKKTGKPIKFKNCCLDIHQALARRIIEDGQSASYSLKNGKTQHSTS